MKCLSVITIAVLAVMTASSQETPRPSSSLYLPAFDKPDVSVPFAVSAQGKRFNPTWGVDVAWANEQNVRKGIIHMGKENVGIGRSAYRFTEPLVNDSALTSEQIEWVRSRSNMLNLVDSKLPVTLTADQEAGTCDYYVVSKRTNNDHWAAMINSHVHWMQANTKHPIVGISPYNEPDYWTTEEGSTVQKQWQIAKLLKENYPRCAEIPIVGGNTLNNDKANEWYSSGKQYYDWGNTHQLAGSFDTFASFYETLQNDGKVGYGDEMHNVGNMA